METSPAIEVSVIVPVFNAEPYVEPCLKSVVSQEGVDLRTVELSVFNDASTDSSGMVIRRVLPALEEALGYVRYAECADGPAGCGSARNRAIENSTGKVLVFLDADDLMAPDRIARSLGTLVQSDDGGSCTAVVGGNFRRIPDGSTPRYQAYHESLHGSTSLSDGLFAFAFRDAPLAMPTVACLRRVWKDVGKFTEGTRVSEDLMFQYAAMERGFRLSKLGGNPLVQYRFHKTMTSNLLTQAHMLAIRVAAFERLVVNGHGWQSFSIWGAGRDGKAVYKMLSEDTKKKVVRWGEINPRKIGLSLYGVKVVHFSELKPPFATCVALDRRGREFEKNLADMNLTPDVDFVYLT